jgi:hypothetical protein
MRLIDAEWITYVLRKIAQAEDKDLSKGEFGQGYVSGVYHAISVIKSTEACLPRVCKHCHLVQYHDNNYCDRCGRLIDEAPTVEERKLGHWDGGGAYYCSNCNAYSATDVFGGGLDITEQHYCYNCGAIMDGQAICDD